MNRGWSGGIRLDGEAVEIRLKVVPGASRTRVVGMLGDRLKVQVAAPPQGGRANKALIACLAAWLAIPEDAITIVGGHSSPLKTARLLSVGPERVSTRLSGL